MVEIGRLEERMKKSQAPTKAPQPVRPTREDATIEDSEPEDPFNGDILAADEAQRLKSLRSRGQYGRQRYR